MFSSRSHLLILLLVIAGVVGFQLSHISRPPFDAHNFRQSQTLSTIELFAKDGIDLLHPRVNYYGEPGAVVLEFPIYQAICATAYELFGQRIEVIRIFNVLFTLGSALAVFRIARRRLDAESAYTASILYLSSPLNLTYMSAILIDPLAVCCALWSFHLCDVLLSGETNSWRTELLLAVCCLITAVIKPLYLFGVCILIGVQFLRQRRLTAPLVRASAPLVIAGAVFLVWNRYASQANNLSFFTRDVHPTMLLGFSELVSFSFIRRVGRWILIEMIGPVGGMGMLGGCLLAIAPKSKLTSDQRLFLLTCAAAALGYWATFAHITYHHDYYSLISVPFCAMISGAALSAVGRAIAERTARPAYAARAASGFAAFAAVVSVAFFLSAPRLAPNKNAAELARLSAGRFEPYAYAMVFVGAEKTPGGDPIHDSPAMLYAARVRGTGLVVADEAQALSEWNRLRPHYRNLRYVIFYGLKPPAEIAAAAGSPSIDMPQSEFIAYDLAHVR